MKHERVTGEIQETAALYALGSLSQNDARAFESHLAEGCVVCETERTRFENVVGTLGLTASDAVPPPSLRELLAAHLEHQGAAVSQPAAPEPRQKEPELAGPLWDKRPAPRPKVRWLRFAPWILAIACAIAAEEYYFAWKRSQQTIRANADEIAAARGDAAQLSGMLELERSRSRELEHINAVLGKPGARVIMLAGTEISPSASVAIIWDTGKKRWVVTGNLPPAPAGKRYQIWCVTPGGRNATGVLEQDAEGHVFKLLDIPDPAAGSKEIVITLEPPGGSMKPTWPVIASSGILTR